MWCAKAVNWELQIIKLMLLNRMTGIATMIGWLSESFWKSQ